MVIHNITLDPKVSRGARGGPRFFTTIIAAFSGYEKANANWATARLRWDIGHVVNDMTKLAYVLSFFRARQGRAYGFLFRDPSDYYAGMSYVADVLTPNAVPEVLAATGDGATLVFQLTKTYTDTIASSVRTVYRPIQTDFTSGADVSPKIYTKTGAGAWTLKTVTTDYSINFSTGKVTFVSAPAAGVQIGWAGQFCIAARFDTDDMIISLDAANVGEWQSIPVVEVRE